MEKEEFNDQQISIDKDKLKEFFQKNVSLLTYLSLAIITYLGIFLRTRNLNGLKDVSTNNWTLGPDLDPFLFLRWAKEIVSNGSLFIWDQLRYSPLGYNTSGELKFLAYLIAWFHDLLSIFSLTESVNYSAVMFPVFMFALTTIAFFFFARKIFSKEDKIAKNAIAILATLIFVLIPSLLPRTIAGIPEKESAAFFFMFIAFYFFMGAYDLKNKNRSYLYSLFSGISTGLMALVWGGYIFVMFAIPSTILICFLIGKINNKERLNYSIWLLTAFIVMMPFSTRYSLSNLVHSTSTGSAILVLLILWISYFIEISKNPKKFEIKNLNKEISHLVYSLILIVILASIALGPLFIANQLKTFQQSLTQPLTSRFQLTVAENRQPFFMSDWANNFGPILFGIPIYFWLFFTGSIALFYFMTKSFENKEKWTLIVGYFIFISSIIFSKYSSNSIFDGASLISLSVYFGGAFLFIFILFRIYLKNFKENKKELFQKIEFSYILYFISLVLGIIAARSAIRLIMVLGTISPIAVAFLIVYSGKVYLANKSESRKLILGIVFLIFALATLFTIQSYYNQNVSVSESFVPNSYTNQWQYSMQWVRENTPTNSVFAHWWDYGYWVQSIGERATILDGGNAINYWNYLMGRYVLTGNSEKEMLEFLYSHNATHLLIDSTDIGKYTAFSSIGSDENYDRFSWINTFILDETQTQKNENQTRYILQGQFVLDQDLVVEMQTQKILLPEQRAAVPFVIINEDSSGNFLQPEVVIIDSSGNQYVQKIRYLYSESQEVKYDFEEGLEWGIVLFPFVGISNQNLNLNPIGSGMLLSERTVNSNLAKYYLFNEESNNVKIAHIQDSLLVSSLKDQNIPLNNLAYVEGYGFQGPIKIWNINYDSDIYFNSSYIEKDFPNPKLNLPKEGKY